MSAIELNRNEQATRLKRKMTFRREILSTLIVLPTMIGFFCFTLFPMLISLIVSFTELHSYNIKYMEFNGIENYKWLFTFDLTNGWLGSAIKNTLIYVCCIPVNVVVAIFLANIIAKKLAGSKFMRIILFMPQVCSGVAVTMVFKWMFQEDFGMINTALATFGVPKLHWMTDANTFSFGVAILSLWMNGTNIIVLESGFLNVDKSIQEAARIDGATEMQVFWKITFPALTPTIFYIWTMWFLAGLQEQTMMQIISTNGTGPSDRALTIVYYIYKMAFQNGASQGFGLACALSWIVAIIIILLTRLNFWLSKFWVCYDF